MNWAGGHIRQIYHYRELLWNLIVRDIKTRSKQSFLGYLWIVINPFFSMIVYTIIVSVFLGAKLTEIPYPVFVFCNLLPWNFFANTLEASTGSLVAHASLITHVAFPREILPIASLMRPLFDLGVSYLMLSFLMIVYAIPIHMTVIFVPVLLLMQMIFTLGLAFFLSALNVYYRDIAYFIGILLRGWMFLSPVVYPINRVPQTYMPFYLLNPMSPLIDGYRQLILMGKIPDSGDMMYVLAVAVGVFVSGYLFFKRLEPTFADVV